jgi:hypothetical protein
MKPVRGTGCLRFGTGCARSKPMPLARKETTMPRVDATSNDPSPNQPIRRFDVFAEYTRQERREKGFPEDQAKGYGIWLAKVVASRRFGQQSSSDGKKLRKQDAHEDEPTFRSVGDELQTDETFDHDIIERMGAKFYDAVFMPAISEARAEGKSYETIRDTIRRGWKPARATPR